jgi:hypothetical protein
MKHDADKIRMHKIRQRVPKWDRKHIEFLNNLCRMATFTPFTRRGRFELAVELLIEDIRSYELSA